MLLSQASRAGLFTILILKRRLYLHHWQGMLLITVGTFIVGVSSLVSSVKCQDGHRLPPYIPPYSGPPDAPPAPADCFGAACDSQWLYNDAAGSEPPGSPLASGLIAHLSTWLEPQWNALWAHGDSSSPEKCSIGHEPLLGNACVMAAQVRLGARGRVKPPVATNIPHSARGVMQRHALSRVRLAASTGRPFAWPACLAASAVPHGTAHLASVRSV